MKQNKIMIMAYMIILILATSCSGSKNLVVPHAVSIAQSIPVSALNLEKNEYQILKTITETSSVTVEYHGSSIRIKSGDGDFQYIFEYDSKNGWSLNKFSGIATFGYLASDSNNHVDIPDAEEFARRVAVAKIIEQVKDYNADGVIDPVVTTQAFNSGNRTVEYKAIVTARIFKLKTND